MLSFCLNAQQKRISTIKATYYHDRFENRKTSSGEKFSQKLYTAAHKTLPFNTIVRITNPKTSQSVLVKINDRCRRAGVVDLTKIAASRINLLSEGIMNVKLEVMKEDYTAMWEMQDEMYSLFDSLSYSLDMQLRYIDSLSNTIENKQIFSIAYFVKIATVEGEEEMMSVLYSIPEKYRNQVKHDKIYNENFYEIMVGPFITKEAAGITLSDLRKRYPSAHLIKNKVE